MRRAPERRGLRHTFTSSALLLAVAATVTGCPSPRIQAFSASPRRICPDSKTVTLTWSVDGSARLSSTAPAPGLGAVDRCGRLDIPAKEGEVTLTASKCFAKDVRSVQVLEFVKGPQQTTLAPDSPDVTCDETRREAVAVVEFEPTEFDAGVRVHALQNAWDREVAVAHRGRAWTVPAGGTVTLEPRPGPTPDSGVFTGGPWVLRARLRDDEHCGSPSAKALLHILFNATIGC